MSKKRVLAVNIVHQRGLILEPVCCKKQQKIPITGLRSRGPLKDLKDSKLSLNE